MRDSAVGATSGGLVTTIFFSIVVLTLTASFFVVGFFLLRLAAPGRRPFMVYQYVNDPDRAVGEFLFELSSARATLQMVGGDPARTPYDTEEFARAIDAEFSRNPELRIEALFPHPHDARLSDTPLASIARKHPTRFHLYELAANPRIHFRIVDFGSTVFVEEPHAEAHGQRSVRVVRKATLAAREFEDEFLRLKERSRRV